MKLTKLFAAAAILIAAAGVCLIGYMMWVSYDYNTYKLEITRCIADGLAEDSAYASVGGTETHLNDNNLEMLQALFVISSRKMTSVPKTLDTESGICLKIGEKAVFRVIQPDADVDFVYLLTEINGHKRNFTLDNYRVYDRMLEFISPEGRYGINEIVQ